MPDYSAVELSNLNDTFVHAVMELSEVDYLGLRQWLQFTFKISTPRNVDAWFGRAGFERNFLSSNTPNAQKPYRIMFAKAFCFLIPINQPTVCKDFHLNPEGDQRGKEKFEDYFYDDFVITNIVSLNIDEEELELCYKKYPDETYNSSDDFDMNDPAFDEFRSGEEVE